MWPVRASLASGSRKLSAGCGLSGRNRCVGQKNCRRGVVCRGEIAVWVKRPVAGMWSVGAKSLSGSRGQSAECGLSGRKGRMGQGASRRSVVCRGENAAWVKEIVGGVWSVGAKSLSGSRGQSAECGLSGRNRRVNQRNPYCMPQTSQITTQIKIAKTLKT